MPKNQKLVVYEYSGCSTCKKALKFLDAKKIPYEKKAIVEHPPTKSELKRMLELLGGELKKLFNTSGLVYREMGLGAKMKDMKVEQAIELLSKNGKLIKRPFLLGSEWGAVGFDEKLWKKMID